MQTGPIDVWLPPPTAPTRRHQTIEVAIFLALILPPMLLSLVSARQSSEAAAGQEAGFVTVASVTIARDTALVGLILYFLWRNREPLARIGWTHRRLWDEIGLGLVLYVPVFFLVGWAKQFFESLGLTSPDHPWPALMAHRGAMEQAMAVALVIVVAVAEETLFRGYLILRFAAVFGNTAAAVIVSCALFAIGHTYEGSAGVATVGLLGLVLALVYVWRGSIVAPVTMHFCQDFIGVVLAPLLAGS